jgi:hypothetical protein
MNKPAVVGRMLFIWIDVLLRVPLITWLEKVCD